MTTFLQRIAFALGLQREPKPEPSDDRLEYDFGPNVPVEDLGGKPCYYENGQPVYWEKAP